MELEDSYPCSQHWSLSRVPP